jgi:hypothetical protein
VAGDLCTNGSVYYYVQNASDYPGATYNWFRGTTEVQRGSLSYYIATAGGVYSVQVVASSCSSLSDFDTLNVSSTSIDKAIIASTAGTNLCQGTSSIVLRLQNVSAYGSSTTYQWFKNNVPIAGETSSVYTVTDSGHYRIMVIDGSCSSMSDSIRITKNGTGSIVQPVWAKQPNSTTICVGGSIVYTVTNTGSYSNNVQYIWFNGSTIVQQGSLPSYTATDSGVYYVEAVDGSCASVSIKDTLIRDAGTSIPAEIESVSGTYVICGTNGSIILILKDTALHAGSTYQWYRNGTLIAGATNIIYQATDSGSYKIQVTQGTCSSMSPSEYVSKDGTKVIAKPNFSTIPDPGQICAGGGAVMLVARSMGSAYVQGTEYVWYHDNHIVSRSTSPVYIAKAAGVYFVQVITGGCSSSSDPQTISSSPTTIAQAEIVSTSGGTVVCSGTGTGNRGSIVMQLSNGDDYSTGASYQWYKNNVAISGETGRIYVATDSGEYRIMVMDGGCSTVSDSIKVTRDGAHSIKRPVLATHPSGGVICGGDGSVILLVTNTTAYSSTAIYLWLNDTGIVQSGSSPSYVVTEAGDYFVQVVDGGCSSESSKTTVNDNGGSTSIVAPDVVSLSDETNICQDAGSIVLRVTNSSAYSSSATYQWYWNGKLLTGETHNFCIAQDSGIYRVQVVDGTCSAVSDSVEITKDGTGSITEQPILTKQPNSSVICINGQVYYSVSNSSSYTNAEYLWYKDMGIVKQGTEPYYFAIDTGVYFVQVIEGTCSSVSKVDTLRYSGTTINVPVLISSSPSLELCTGGSLLLSVGNTTDYGQNARYIWFKDMQKQQDSTLSSYEVTSTGVYFVQVVDGMCSSVSKFDTVVSGGTIVTPLVESAPVSNTICGDTGVVILTLANETDYTTPVIQWYKNSVLIPGATQRIYIANTSGLYRVHVSDGSCSAFSDTLRLNKNNTVITKPVVSSSSPSGVICGTNGSVLLTVTNTGNYSASNVRYVWYKGTNIVQDSLIYTYEAQDSGAYFVQVIDGNCSAVSAPITLTKSTTGFVAPLVATIPGNADICGDTGVVFLYVTNTNVYTNPSYQWYNGAVLIPGATHSSYSATDSGDYRVIVVEGNCSAFSSIVHVSKTTTTINKPIIASYPSTGYIYGGNMVKLFLQNESMYSSVQYNWYRGDTLITTDTVCTTNVAGSYRLLLVDGNCAAWSNIIVLTDTVCNVPSFVLNGNTMSMCDSTSFDLAQVISIMSPNSVMKYYADNSAQLELPSSIVSPHTNTTYYLQSLDTITGCRSLLDWVDMTVIAKPSLPSVAVPDMIYANGGAVSSYTIGTAQGVSYPWAWVSGDSIIGISRNGSNIVQWTRSTAINTDSVIKKATYMYTASMGSQQCSAADTGYFEIIILPTPNVIVSLPSQEICSGEMIDTIAFTGRVDSTVYTWERTLGTDLGLPATGTGDIYDNVLVNNGSVSVTLMYKVTPILIYRGVTSTGQDGIFSIMVKPQPALTGDLYRGEICSGSTFAYNPEISIMQVKTSWKRVPNPHINDGDSSSGQTKEIRGEALTNTSDTTVRVIYEYTLTSDDGCIGEYNVTVDVLPASHITIPYLNEICIGEPIVEIPYTSLNNVAVDYKIEFSTDALNVGFVSTDYRLLQASPITIAIPLGVQAGAIYTGKMLFKVGDCIKESQFAIRIAKPTRITTQPVSQVDLCDGESNIALMVQADGDSLSYQWYRDGVAIIGATSNTYDELFTSELEGRYYVEVTGTCGMVTSDTVDIRTRGLMIQEKWDNSLYVGNPDGQYVRYQWYKNGVPITSGSTFQYYTDPHGFVGTYKVRAYFADNSYVESCSITLNRSKTRKMILFPNPVQSGGIYKIQLDGENLDNAIIEITDVPGKLIETHVMSGDYIELRARYAPGGYYVRIITKEGIKVKKLIVE